MKNIIIIIISICFILTISSCNLNQVNDNISKEQIIEEKEEETIDTPNFVYNKSGNYANKGYLDFNKDYIFYKYNSTDNIDSIYKTDKLNQQTLIISDLKNCSNIVTQDEYIFFLERDYKNVSYKINRIKNDGTEFQSLIDSNFDITNFIIYENNLYFIADSGNKDEVDLPIYCLYKYSITDKSNDVLDKNVSKESNLIAYENKIIYTFGTYLKINNLETNSIISTLTTNYGENLAMLQCYGESLYYTNGTDIKVIEISNIKDNLSESVLISSAPEELFSIRNINISDNYIFFTGQYKERKYGDTTLLNVYRINKDGSEFKKIAALNFNLPELDNRVNNFLYILDNNLILIDYFTNVLNVLNYDGEELKAIDI